MTVRTAIIKGVSLAKEHKKATFLIGCALTAIGSYIYDKGKIKGCSDTCAMYRRLIDIDYKKADPEGYSQFMKFLENWRPKT